MSFTEPPLAWDWNFPKCKINDPDACNLDFLTPIMEVEFEFQLIIGTIGIASNVLAMSTLCNKSMKSVLNKLELCLLALHTIYIFCSILYETLRPEWEYDGQEQILDFSYSILFSFLIHPIKQFILFSSIFATVLMVRQRYLAIRPRAKFRDFIQSTNPWKSSLKYFVAVFITAALFTFPMYGEMQFMKIEKDAQIININSTHFQCVST